MWAPFLILGWALLVYTLETRRINKERRNARK